MDDRMRQEITLRVKNKFSKQYKGGYPLITKEAVINGKDLKDEGVLVKLVDEANQFLGKGYYGNQNKGYGWIVTNNENEEMDTRFFVRKLQQAFGKRDFLMKDDSTTAYRLFNGEGDGIGGFTIEYFNGYLVINWYSEGIYTFKEEVIAER